MKQVCRLGVFETNSSSTHTLTIVARSEFDLWKDGMLVFNRDEETLGTLTQFQKEFEDNDERTYYDSFEEYQNENIQTYEEWLEDECLECFEMDHTTPSGDKIVAFGKFGNDC